MKHRPVVEPGAHSNTSADDTLRELKELESEMRRNGAHRAAKTCSNAARIINALRRMKPENRL